MNYICVYDINELPLYSKLNDMKTYELEIEQDNDPMNPRTDWDNITTMICFHRNYNLGDKHDYKKDNFGSWEELKEQIESDHKVLMIKPLRLYDHSGITISTSNEYPFNDRFDSMMVGWVFITEKQLELMCGKDFDRSEEKLNDIIDSDVKTYDSYITGEVYQYTIYEIETCDKGHEHKTLLESCGSFFDEEDCRGEGMNVLSIYEKEKEVV
jgi:hypothetical protein